ncbi:unnamed protein product [Rhizoctonia solani]|uniref:Uncharacterized protein n=1 Tax=Rhizoctonia solani TaxID=456999 RepID=A0A8H3BE70_9AGAM|nr:unnamed protein product [Rhizoctonia solani]
MTIATPEPVTSPIVAGPFECFGEGLLYRGIKCEHPKTLKNLLLPTRSSKPTAIKDKDRPRMWWRAQCLHYGLPSPPYSTISSYRACLERALRQSGGLKRPLQLIDLEIEQNAAFGRLNPKALYESNVNRQQQPEATELQEKSRRTHTRTNSSSVSHTTASRKRKADTATSYHPKFSELAKSRLIIPASMKRARVHAPVPSATLPYARPRVAPKNLEGDSSVRKGISGGSSGKYELEYGFGPSSRSHEKPTLYVSMLDSGWFQAALIIPGFFECLIRPRANANVAINGHLRFEWCGWNEQMGEVVYPSVDNIGWLKMYNTEGRVKGAIQTPLGLYLIQGPRVKSGSHVIQEKWEDYCGRTRSNSGG